MVKHRIWWRSEHFRSKNTHLIWSPGDGFQFLTYSCQILFFIKLAINWYYHHKFNKISIVFSFLTDWMKGEIQFYERPCLVEQNITVQLVAINGLWNLPQILQRTDISSGRNIKVDSSRYPLADSINTGLVAPCMSN